MNEPSNQQQPAPAGKSDFGGLRVAALESRRAADMQRLIERHGGQARVSPSMRERPLEDQSAAVEFAKQLMTGQVDVVILMTGVGFEYLLQTVERNVDRERFLTSLADITTIARGPKPTAAMKKAGLTPTHRVPEPNTWRELLATIDECCPLANQRVVLQEYGVTNVSLIAGLEARGAHVKNLRIYDWALPEDTRPLEENVLALAGGEIDVLLLTSAQQIENMLAVADHLGLAGDIRERLKEIVVCSIGPTTSERLRELSLPVDLEPTHPRMGQLVAEAAQRAPEILDRKRQITRLLADRPQDVSDRDAPWLDSPFMKACRREPTDFTPVWLMRQAGRYMPEYRKVRSRVSFIDLCKSPALCSEVMCTAVERLGVDAAIVFSDLPLILEPMGLELEYVPGPVIHNPVRETSDIRRVLELESIESLHFVFETVRQTRNDLPAEIPLIGFSGAPFTLASYAIEGGASRNYLHTKTLMYRDEPAWRDLMQRMARAVSAYLNAQIAAGAQCVQLFDSWAGCLGVGDYRHYVLPYVRQIIDSLTPGVPVINFATGNPALLPELACGGDTVVGVDWRIGLGAAWQTVGSQYAVQGNLDPCALLADRDEIYRRVQGILDEADGRPGHIFNLGHGILPQTPVDNAIALVDAVHELSSS